MRKKLRRLALGAAIGSGKLVLTVCLAAVGIALNAAGAVYAFFHRARRAFRRRRTKRN